jgi:hypothetical protein
VQEVQEVPVVQAAPTFAQAMAKVVQQVEACWTQQQWR